MHHLFPVDGYVNAMRSNYPLGDVDPGNIRYTSTNGALLGGCSSSQAPSDQKCFEMPDEWKGDFARCVKTRRGVCRLVSWW
jgi:endonuclease I